ncbi:metallophosphoesterase family protein [Metabacillus sp. Hm71]|uniref:metallophosphoesterase family protein n=1 Tax=Metabacillus sp. Hm71 TaxID=3450743 RepID=UPI003F42982B
MRKSIRFIHAADLHIDSPFVGLKHLPSQLFEKMKESTFLAFSKLISIAIKEQVDFVLLSGDLYDAEERSLKAQLRVKKEFERLAQAGIKVYVIHGNHDHLGGKWLDLNWPGNVHVFSSKQVEMEIFSKGGTPHAYIYGYSYPSRSVIENMTTHYQKKDNHSVFHIGMLHGSIEGNKEHDVYCPFKISDLVSKDFDYWALGHIHKRQILHERNPIIAYPGNIQGRHRKEAGEKGFYLVAMHEDKASMEFISTEEVIWEDVELSISSLTSFSELISECQSAIEQFRKNQRSACLTITLTGAGDLSRSLQSKETIQDLIDALNEEEAEYDPFVWVVKIVNQATDSIEKNPKLSSFFNDLHTTVENYQSFEEVIQPLAQHPLYRKYIAAFTLEEQKQLLAEAEQLIHKELVEQSEVKKS